MYSTTANIHHDVYLRFILRRNGKLASLSALNSQQNTFTLGHQLYFYIILEAIYDTYEHINAASCCFLAYAIYILRYFDPHIK